MYRFFLRLFVMYFKYSLFGLNVRCSLINKFYFHHRYFHIWYNCYYNNYLPLLVYDNHCTRNQFSPKCSEKMVFSKKLQWNMTFLALSGKMIFLFSPKYDLILQTENERRSFSKKIHGNMIFSASVLKRWSFQETHTGIWSSFNCQEIRYFYFPEIWSRSSSSYFELICSDLLV